MKPIKIALWASLLLLAGVWLICDPTEFSALRSIFDWRNFLLQFSGVIAIGAMSLALLLAIRPVWLESRLSGLDKMYRLHKWLGIGALGFSLAHWLIANGPKWAVALGWLERRGRRQRPSLPEGSWQQLFASQRGLAESVGEWAFYLAALLMLLALIPRFPYRRFFQTHRLLALTYLALVFHAIILFRFESWLAPSGWLMAALLLIGSLAALLAFFRQRLSRRRVQGRIARLEWQENLRVLAVDVELAAGWPGHQAGQFAFVSFAGHEEPHPFTIASAWQDDGRMRFLIKALGDYTGQLAQTLKPGQALAVEGPYGCFTFTGESQRQIWISGGIGVTPFMARMQALAGHPGGGAVDFFHCTSEMTPAIEARLREAAANAGVNFHLFWQTRLSLAGLQQALPEGSDWRAADIWFCGPAGLGQMLRQQMLAAGLPAARFHQELFAMR